MTGPNGDSLDGFVFPPFIPTTSRATPAPPPAPAAVPRPAPAPAPEASVDPVEAQPARATMPWDAQTPIVRDQDAGHGDEDEHEDLPWLEVPAPREPAPESFAAPVDFAPPADEPPADEAPAVPAADEGFPDWMAWGAVDEAEAAREMGNVDPVAGLENLVPMHDAPAAPGADATLPALPEPVTDEPRVVQAEAPAPPAEPAPAAEDDGFLAAGFGGGDFLLRALQASQVPPADEVAEPAAAQAPAPAEVPAEPDPFTAASVAQAEALAPVEVSAAEPEPMPVPAVSPQEQPAAVAHALADTFGEVAGRLEGIARTLRENPDALLSGASDDPLALLVTGYVLGYTQGRRS